MEIAPNRTQPNAVLVARLLDNRQAFLGFLERRVGDRALAEDILQEAFVRGIDRLSSVRDDESVTAWFYRVLRNAVVDHARRRASEQRNLLSLAEELQTLDHESAPDLKNEVCACITRLADTLKPEYAESVRRIDVEGVALKVYAEEVGITPNNAAVRVFRAREALKKRLRDCCGACADHSCVDCSCAKT